MELKHLRYFVVLAEELHFGRAAERLRISQPPLSQMVRRLEQELGVALFSRTSRNVELTEPGRLFLEEARRTLSQAAHAVRVAQEARDGEVGHLEVGFVHACGVFPLAARKFARRFPGVKLTLRHMSTAEQVASLVRGTLDVGFVHLPVNRDGLVVEEVQRDALMVALPVRHALASRSSITWRSLADQPFVGFARAAAPEAYDALLLFLRQAGFSPHVVYETDSLLARLRIVGAGFGVSLVPAYAVGFPRPGVVLRPLAPPRPRVGIGVVHAPSRVTPALQAFLAMVREAVADSPGKGVKGPRRRRRGRPGRPRKLRTGSGSRRAWSGGPGRGASSPRAPAPRR